MDSVYCFTPKAATSMVTSVTGLRRNLMELRAQHIMGYNTRFNWVSLQNDDYLFKPTIISMIHTTSVYAMYNSIMLK